MYGNNDCGSKTLVKSSWTPLSNKSANKKLFDERRSLVLTWFSKWSDSQKKDILRKLVEMCSGRQLEYLELAVRDKVPVFHADFTRILPRVLSLYIFSFLDPRSLCRCAQVCWYWRYLCESNELWASKCVLRGWDNIENQSFWEPGIWKKHYIKNIRYMQITGPSKSAAFSVMEKMKQFEQQKGDHMSLDGLDDIQSLPKYNTITYEKVYKPKQNKFELDNQNLSAKMTPWRVPNKYPDDIHRLNYLDNTKTPVCLSARKRLSAGGSVRLNSKYSSSPISSDSLPRDKKMYDYAVNKKKHSNINPMLIGPQIPWRPTSKFPTRSSDLDIKKTQKQFDLVKKFVRHQSLSATRSKYSQSVKISPDQTNHTQLIHLSHQQTERFDETKQNQIFHTETKNSDDDDDSTDNSNDENGEYCSNDDVLKLPPTYSVESWDRIKIEELADCMDQPFLTTQSGETNDQSSIDYGYGNESNVFEQISSEIPEPRTRRISHLNDSIHEDSIPRNFDLVLNQKNITDDDNDHADEDIEENSSEEHLVSNLSELNKTKGKSIGRSNKFSGCKSS